MRLARVCEHVQLDDPPRPRLVLAEIQAVVADLDHLGLTDLCELARDALAEAWRWHLGHDAIDSRIRLARLARTMWRSLGTVSRN